MYLDHFACVNFFYRVSLVICLLVLFYGFRMQCTEILRKYRLRQNDISEETLRITCRNIAILEESINNQK